MNMELSVYEPALIYLITSTGIRCNDIVPSVFIENIAIYGSAIDGSAIEDDLLAEIRDCTSGVLRVGYEGDTCTVMYDNVTELWLCEDNMDWTKTSCKFMYVHLCYIPA